MAATDKVVKRGYVKWTDEDGVFHKEPLADHPDLLAKADAGEQLQAEEARRLNQAAEEFLADREEGAEQDAKDTVDALKKAPEDVLTAAQLVAEAPASGPEDNGEKSEEVERLQEPAATDHEAGLAELRERTAD